MEDRVAFEGVSKDAICEYFCNWVNTYAVRRPGRGPAPIIRLSPASLHATGPVYMSTKKVMESATLREDPSVTNPTGFFLKVAGRVVLIDGQYGEHHLNPSRDIDEYDRQEIGDGDTEEEEDLEEDEYDPIEGTTEY